MGSSPRAHLAYGYDLGNGEGFKAAERDEFGGPHLPWLPVDEDEDADPADFGEELEKALLASIGFTETDWRAEGYHNRKRTAKQQLGVHLHFSGGEESTGWVLVATGSESSVDWDETMGLDPGELIRRPNRELWDTKLAYALTALGITPTQDGPKWLVYPSYG